MLNATRELINEMKEVKDHINKYAIQEFDPKYVDTEMIAAYIKAMRLFDISMDYLEKQAELLDGMDKKLDKLLLAESKR